MARHLLTRMHRARAQKHPEADSVEMLNKYNKYMIRLSPFQCGVCQFYFNRQRDFLDHMGSSKHVLTCQDMLGPIMCVACKYKTHKHNEMMEHVQYPEHLVAVEKKHGTCIVRESHTRITCKFCGVKMYSAVRMRRHCQRRHNDRLTEVQVAMFVKPVEYNKYDCPMCKKSFRAKSLLQLHFLKIHKNTSLFNCNVCNRGYLDQRRLDNHLRTRFHAKRVIAQKLTSAQKQKSAGLRATTIGQKLNKRRGRAKRTLVRPLDVNQGAKVTDQKKEDPKDDYSQRLRRSTRKRKKMEFFDDDPEEEKEPEPVQITEPDHEIQINRKSRKKWTRLRNAKDGQGEKKKINLSLKNSGTDKSETSDGKAEPMNTKNESVISETTNHKDKNSSPGNKSSRKTVKKTEKTNSVNEENANENTDCLEEDSEENFSEKDEDDDDFSLGEGETDAQDSVDEEKLNEASKHIFSCTYCDFAATDLTGLRGHYNENHPNDILTCQPCNQYFLSLKAYKIHCSGRGHQLKLREQSGETKMHKCPMCDKRFLQESCCLLHLETVHRHPSCETDIQRINKGQDLVTQLYGDHVKQVESLSNETSVSCPECGKFVRKDTLVEHLRLHTGERPYACRFCSKGFAGRLTLRRHISSHLNMPMFMCDTCGREFKRNSHLIKHIRQHDFEKKGEKHTCQICKASFFTPEELSRHMRRHGERNYKCAWPGCHWTFVLSGELKSHMFTHTGEKKYLCDICGFGAPTKTRLRRHEKTHDKSRNFNCDYCPYKASCKTHLKRHMRIHINSRPFACPYCNYTCNTHENIRKHILKTQKHKGMKLYPCKLCGNFGCDSSKEFRAHLMTVHANYLRENSIDSLAVFSGLYKREEDFQQPKEGSQIIQVTKGRFFRSYQNPDAPIEPPKPKKPKKSSLKSKMEEVKVIIVHPSELGEDVDKLQHKEEPEQFLQQLQQEKKGQLQQQQHHLSQAHQQQQGQLRQLLQDQQQHQNHQQQMMMEQQEDESQEEEEEEVEQDDEEAEEESSQETEAQQYIEVPNMVIHSFNPQQSQQLSGTTVSFTSSVLPHTQPQQLPVTVSMTDDKLYWTVLPEHKVVLPAAPTPEPWYSGMPQVHAPTSQELQQYRPIEVTTSHPGNFLSNSYFCNIPVGDIQTIQSTVGCPIYTSLVENVVVLSDPTRPETASL
ncbi:unnamed protein product [Lymnaea stagnalis]|uniref:C2H2-type domain-containing protein n=1 Tax=Lymnaea stagnalis TaxID=6523 RepID=A0AAV2HX93_LYMST